MSCKRELMHSSQVHEEGGNALPAVRRVRIDAVPEEVVVRLQTAAS